MTLTPEQWNYIYLGLSMIAGYCVKHFGVNFPIIHQLLVMLFPQAPGSSPVAPGTPGSPGGPAVSSHPILDGILAGVKKLLNNPNATQAEQAAAVKQATAVMVAVEPVIKPVVTTPPVA